MESIHAKAYIHWKVHTMEDSYAHTVRVYIVETTHNRWFIRLYSEGTHGEGYTQWRVHMLEDTHGRGYTR